MPPTLADIAAARAALESLEAEEQLTLFHLHRLRATVAEQLRHFLPADIPDAYRNEIRRLEFAAGGLRQRCAQALQALQAQRGEYDRRPRPDEPLQALAGRLPVTLLPVRLETRYAPDHKTLKVRIYPDQIHIHQHDPALTADERAAADEYDRALKANDLNAQRHVWQKAAETFGPHRATWLVTAGADPGRPRLDRAQDQRPTPTARALPERWLAVGYRTGKVVCRVWAHQPVAERLYMSPFGTSLSARAPSTQQTLPSELAWLTDYDEALKQGMAVTITEGQPELGFDRLIVLGVDWTRTADESAACLNDLLKAHLFSDGLSIVAPGTATNATATSLPGSDPGTIQALTPHERSMAPQVEAALGVVLRLPDTQWLASIPGGQAFGTEATTRLFSALWSSTGGYFLGQLLAPLVTPARQAEIRAFARDHLRPNGCAPTLRIGKQPYGILPVLAPGPVAGPAIDGLLAKWLPQLRQPWTAALDRVPRLRGGAAAPATALADQIDQILRQAPQAATLQFRRVLSPTTVANSTFSPDVHEVQQRLGQLLRGHFKWAATPRVAALAAEPTAYPLALSFVYPRDTSTRSPDYIAEIREMCLKPTARDLLAARLGNLKAGDCLLEALLLQSALNTFDACGLRILSPIVTSWPSALRDTGYFQMEDVHHIARPAPGLSIATPENAAKVVMPDLGSEPIGRLIGPAAAKSSSQNPLFDAVSPLRTLVQDLDSLSKTPLNQLDLAFRGVLDCFSYRLDAWIGALAHHRLSTLSASSKVGAHLGGYGWVEDLKPDTGTRFEDGFLMAPSLAHAATAAVLRSGQQSQEATDEPPLSIDLSSRRVSRALRLLDGVGRNQPLGALLGCQFERSLRDQGLGQFILPIREVAPLRPLAAEDPSATAPTEMVAIRDVCDGAALARSYQTPATRSPLMDKIRTILSARAIHIPPDLNAQLAGPLQDLCDLLDSVQDLLFTESLFQTVQGNTERAGAALGALDQQLAPVRPQVSDTPRTTQTYTQRMIVVTPELLPGPAGPAPNGVLATWKAYATDIHSLSEPRLNAWVAQVLGDTGRIVFRVTLRNRTRVVRVIPVPYDRVGLGPLQLLAASRHTAGQLSELERRIAAAVPLPSPGYTCLVDPGPGQANGIGLEALESLLGFIDRLLSSIRPLNAGDFLTPGATPTHTPDDADVRRRAELVETTMLGCFNRLNSVLAQAPVQVGAVRTALLAASQIGITGAWPEAISREALLAQATRVLDVLKSKARLAADLKALPAPATASALADHHTARIRLWLGDDAPVLTPSRVDNLRDIRLSLDEQAPLTGDDPLRIANWLNRLAHVRPDLDRLASVLTAAAVLGGLPAAGNLAVAQLPYRTGQRWLALNQTGPGAADADLAFVMQCYAPWSAALNSPFVAGFVVDSWTEAIPASSEVLAAAFRYDAPNTRPPQAILIATPRADSPDGWSLTELEAIVNEAFDLARLRMIGPQHINLHGLWLPAVYVPQVVTTYPQYMPVETVAAALADQSAPQVIGKRRPC